MTSFADDDDDHDDKTEGLFLMVAVITMMVMKWIMPVRMMMEMMIAKNICPPFPPPRAEGAFGFLLDHPDPRSSCTEIQ